MNDDAALLDSAVGNVNGTHMTTTCLQEVGSRRSVGIHTATFCLTDEAMDEPPRLLASEAAAAGLPPDAFVTLQHGGIISTAGGADSRRAPLLPVSSPA